VETQYEPVLHDQIIARVIAIYEAGELVRLCAWCGRVSLDDDWFPMPQVALDAIDVPNSTSHTVCPDCTKAVLAEVRERKANG
jgi:hypothetical protein